LILFVGYLNKANFGDDLLLQVASREVKDFAILSSGDSVISHFTKILKANKVILLGGLFQDETSIRSCIYYSSIVLLAKCFAKRVESKATGIGPLRHRFSKFITAMSYRYMDSISVRDEFSSKFLSSHNIKHRLTKDLILNWSYDEAKVDRQKFTETKYHIVSQNPRLSKLESANSLEIICERSQKPSSDLYIYASDYSPDELIYLFKYHCHSLVSQRFHIAVLALIAGIEVNTSDDCFKVQNLIQSFTFDLINE
jgi:polysaccharide pyruvyl transferase WcaK-like protein